MEHLFGRSPLDHARVANGPPQNSFARAPHHPVELTAANVHREADAVVAWSGRPRLETGERASHGFGAQILASFRDRGYRCLLDVRGGFALAIITRDVAVLAVDRMGIETLSWGTDGTDLVFGASAAAVAEQLFANPEINRQALFGFMLNHMVAAPDTAYRGVQKLLAGTCVELRKDVAVTERYWTPNFARAGRADLREMRDAVLPTIRRAVVATEPDARTGAFLSGGLDSSTVTGVLAEHRSGQAKAFSVGFGVDEFNELEYARIAAAKFRCAHLEYEVTADDIVDALPRIAATYPEPFGNSSAVPTYFCARFAKEHGVDHLLAGDGGDEIFGGNERYVRQGVFERYASVPAWLRGPFIDPLATIFDPERSPWPLRKISSYVRQARVPLPERFESWNLIYREGAENVFAPDFLRSIDTEHPLRKMRETWQSCPSNDLLDRMLWYDWKFTLADNDLRKVSEMCALAGVRVSYPMLDEELIDLSIRVPSSAKIHRGELRTFFKDAARGFLPDETIAKKKHGFGLPFGVWLKTNRRLQDLVYGSLEALKKYGVLHVEFVERVAREHRGGHAGYYGYAIWDMVMLEHWLRKQGRASL
jgi:asparagine synthase (glutamine-hydrolysing)